MRSAFLSRPASLLDLPLDDQTSNKIPGCNVSHARLLVVASASISARCPEVKQTGTERGKLGHAPVLLDLLTKFVTSASIRTSSE